MDHRSSSPPLRELLQPVVRQWWLLALVVAVAVCAAIAVSLTQDPVYTARTSVSFQDPTRDLGVLGVPNTSGQSPSQIAAANARVFEQPNVVGRVRRQLRLDDVTVAQLRDRVETTVEPTSSLVELRAQAGTAAGAQRLADAFARIGARAANEAARRSFARQAQELRRRRPGSRDESQAAAETRAVYNAQIGRLRALSTIAEPAKVVDPAVRPGAPTSPRPVRNAAIGGVLGLVLGLGLVFLRDSLDRRLRTPDDIAAEMGIPVIGQVRDQALGRRPRPGDAGQIEELDWERFRIIQRNLDFVAGPDGSGSVAVTSSLPEEGKSTVALYLAYACAAAGRRTALVECDLRRPVLADRLGIPATPGVTDLVHGDATLEQVTQTVTFHGEPWASSANGAGKGHGDARYRHAFDCIVAGAPTRHALDVLDSEPFQALLLDVQHRYDVVVVDTTPMLPVADALQLLPRVSAVVVCARASRITRDQARAGEAALKRLPDRPLGLVITGTRPADDADYGYAYYR